MTGTLLYRGAEADVIRGKWRGLDAVYKVRKPLKYRHPALDSSIRRFRTLHEADIMHSAKLAGVRSPNIYELDPSAFTIVMELIEGARLSDLARSARSSTLRLFKELGRGAARLHRRGIMHGDLTTANVVQTGDSLVFLDFGLAVYSHRVEDHAVDLRLIKETINGAHPEVSRSALELVIEGYIEEAGSSRGERVLKQLQAIERRGRYARVV